MTQPPVRLALLGPGGFGHERARAISASPTTTLVACYSPIPGESEACAHTFGGAAVATAAAIWEDATVDGVVICTPNQLHLPQILEAAAHGKHVFVEKPIAPTVAAAQEIIAACARAGLVLMVGHNSRRFARIRKMKAMLDEGVLGQVIAAEAQYSHPGGLSVQPGDWRWSSDNCPGGPLTQLGVHQIDSLHYLLGPVVRVSAWQRRLAVAAAIDDVTVTLLEFAGGPLAYVGAHYAVADLRYMYLLGTAGNARWDEATGLRLESQAGREKIPVPDDEAATLREEIEEFAACIRTGAAPEVGGAEALQATAVVEAAVLSNQRQRPVDIAELLG
jgi:predicted dehydrogenase